MEIPLREIFAHELLAKVVQLVQVSPVTSAVGTGVTEGTANGTISGSILIELSRVLHTSPNYLLGMEDYEEDLLEIITVYKNLKGSKTKQIALEQMKLLATMSSEL